MKVTYHVDPAHSGIHFSVRHMMISTVRGSFASVKGTVVLDTDNPSASTVEAEIEVGSINTQDEKRDGHLKSPDFFDIGNHPVMTFKSTEVSKKGSDSYTVNGDLTLHGITKPLTLNVEEVSEEIKDPWGGTRVGAVAKGKLKRSDYGMSFNAAMETGGVMLGDEIKLEFELELVKA